mgnify:CR=1 FL=1
MKEKATYNCKHYSDCRFDISYFDCSAWVIIDTEQKKGAG